MKAIESSPGLVVFCTHGINDPLVSSLILEYMIRLQKGNSDREILLFTEESSGFRIEESQQLRLKAMRIEWIPLYYDVKGRQWFQKLAILHAIWGRCRKFKRNHTDLWLVGFLAFGGAYASVLSWIGMGRCATVCFEPHSRYMVELGVWGRHSLKSIVMSFLERLQMRRSDLLIVPTEAGLQLALSQHASGKVVNQAITIDVESSLFDRAGRMNFRSRFNVVNNTVLAYVGKFSGIYYSHQEYLAFIERAMDVGPDLRFLIIASISDLETIRCSEAYGRVSDRLILHPPVPSNELHKVLSGADFGVIAVPPKPSQAYRTPVKTAHYWAAGLPLIVPKGVSDDWKIAEARRVGIVTGDLPEIDAGALIDQLDEYRREDAEEVRKRCISAAFEYRDTDAMVRLLATDLCKKRA